MSSEPYCIYLTADKIIIENKLNNKKISIEKRTYKTQKEESLQDFKMTSKPIYTSGIMGIVSFAHYYYLVYFTSPYQAAVIKSSIIYQINNPNQINYLPISIIPSHQENELQKMQNQFKQIICKNSFYYSSTYDLTNSYHSQRSYLYYKKAKVFYLWNRCFLKHFITNEINIGCFFVFCINGFIKQFNNEKENIKLTFIARIKNEHPNSNHTQIETVMLYKDNTIFSYVMYSFDYNQDIKKHDKTYDDLFMKKYCEYGKRDYDVSNVIIHLINPSDANSQRINQLTSKTFKEQQVYQFTINEKYNEQLNKFIEGIRDFITNLNYNLLYKREEKKTEDNITNNGIGLIIMQPPNIQKASFIIISDNVGSNSIKFQCELLRVALQDFFTEIDFYSKNLISDQALEMYKHSNGYQGIDANNDNQEEICNLFQQQQVLQYKYAQSSQVKNEAIFGKNYEELFNALAQYMNKMSSEGLDDKEIKVFDKDVVLEVKQLPTPSEICREAFKLNGKLAPINSIKNTPIIISDIITTVLPLIQPIENSEIKQKKLLIHIATWNLGGLKIVNIEEVNIRNLLPEALITTDKLTAPDMIFLGFQEIVKLNAKKVIFSSNTSEVECLKNKFQKELSPNYILKECLSLVGVLFLVYISEDMSDKITYTSNEIIKTGFMGTMGNKGSCLFNFTYENKQFSFATGHLCAGASDSNNDNRLFELNTIANTLLKNKRKFIESDYWFMFGDMNFRLELNTKSTELLIKMNRYEDLMSHDQLIITRNRLDFDYEEEPLAFPPTYKYIIGNNKYDKKRPAAWCDRIIYKPSTDIKLLSYTNVDLRDSDHRPVIGIFEINIKDS